MNNRNLLLILVLFFSGRQVTIAQRILTLKEALDLALENNYDIEIAYNNLEVAKNNVKPGQAGLHPDITLTSGADYSLGDAKQQFVNNDTPNVTLGAETRSIRASLGVSYTLFNGFINMNTLKRLSAFAEMTTYQTQATVEQIMMDIVTAYYLVAQLEDAISVSQRNLEISGQVLRRATIAKEIGTDNSLNYYNALVNHNNDSLNLINVLQQKSEALNNLFFTIGAGEEEVTLEKNLVIAPVLKWEIVQETFERQNPRLKAERHNVKIADLDVDLASGENMPRLTASGSYDYQRVNQDAGFINFNRTNGLGLGLSLTYPLYSGGRRQRALQNAKVTKSNSEIALRKLERQLDMNLKNAYLRYTNAFTTYDLNSKNLSSAEVNFKRTNEKFRLGQVTTTQLREAQLNLLTIENEIIKSKYDFKSAEMELKRLMGVLMEFKL